MAGCTKMLFHPPPPTPREKWHLPKFLPRGCLVEWGGGTPEISKNYNLRKSCCFRWMNDGGIPPPRNLDLSFDVFGFGGGGVIASYFLCQRMHTRTSTHRHTDQYMHTHTHTQNTSMSPVFSRGMKDGYVRNGCQTTVHYTYIRERERERVREEGDGR